MNWREKIMKFLIWPTVYKIINGTFFFLISFLKKSVALAIKQIKGQ